jgi:hypothetical protein
VALGIVLIIADAMEDSSPMSIGIALLVAGGSVALAAQLLHMQIGESPQMTPGPSVFGRPDPPAGHAAWQPPGGHQPGPWQRPVVGPPPHPRPEPQPPPTSPLPPPPPG